MPLQGHDSLLYTPFWDLRCYPSNAYVGCIFDDLSPANWLVQTVPRKWEQSQSTWWTRQTVNHGYRAKACRDGRPKTRGSENNVHEFDSNSTNSVNESTPDMKPDHPTTPRNQPNIYMTPASLNMHQELGIPKHHKCTKIPAHEFHNNSQTIVRNADAELTSRRSKTPRGCPELSLSFSIRNLDQKLRNPKIQKYDQKSDPWNRTLAPPDLSSD